MITFATVVNGRRRSLTVVSVRHQEEEKDKYKDKEKDKYKDKDKEENKEEE